MIYLKRYFIVNEFFGSRVYDSVEKTETFFDKDNTIKLKGLLKNNYTEINELPIKIMTESLSAPLKISMNITKSCNLRCKQCFSDSGIIRDKELTTEEVFKLFDDMHQNGTFFICIGGGEPFMRKDILEILDYGNKKQLAISVVSNGLLFTKELLLQLNDKNLDTLWVSFEGLEINHDYLRGKGTFNKTIDALKLLQKYYKGKTAIRVSLNKNNIDECFELIKVAEKFSIDIIRFTPIIAFGRAKNEDLTISQEQYISFLKNIKNIQSTVKIIHPGIVYKDRFWTNSDNFGCHCGKETVWIDELGNYSPCIFLGPEFNSGNIKNDSFINLWKKSLDSMKITGNNTCKKCSNYSKCRGGCRARVFYETGNLNGIDPLCPLRKNLKIDL